MHSRTALLFFVVAVAASCAARQPDGASRAADAHAANAHLIDVPFYAQTVDQCGPAALAMALDWSGLDVAPSSIASEVFTPKRRGSLQPDLVTAARRHGRVAYIIHGRAELLAELHAEHPVVVLQNLGFSWLPRWHYAVVVGYDRSSETVVLHSGAEAQRMLAERTFLNTWERSEYWGLVTLPPDRLPARPDETRWLEAVIGLERAGENDAAAVAYRTAAAYWPMSLAARIGWANAAYATGNLTDAETALREALRGRPDAAVAWNNLADVLGRMGRKREALVAVKRAIALGGVDADVYRETLAEIEAL